MTEEKSPVVFISYAWGDTVHMDRVRYLADRLNDRSVEVIFDQWDLSEGMDKYSFMEQAVAREDVTRVLMLCDRKYKEKANNRDGGVGDETQVISPEVYRDTSNTKFIPLVFEVDETNSPYLPIYLQSRIYIDFSDWDRSRILFRTERCCPSSQRRSCTA